MSLIKDVNPEKLGRIAWSLDKHNNEGDVNGVWRS